MKKIYFIAVAALALAACDNNNDNLGPSSPVAAQISATIGESVATRVSDNSWEEGDAIGITLKAGEKLMPHINVKYTTQGAEKFEGAPIYFYTPMSLTAYYPFYGEEGKAPGIIEARTDDESQKPGNQSKIDFLWDYQTEFHVNNNKPEVEFKFSHKMSKLTLIFMNGSGVDVSKIVSYRIEGLVLVGTFDPETGVCAIKDETESLPLSIELNDEDVEVISKELDGEEKKGISVSPLILFPQSPGTDKVKLHIYSDELDNPALLQHYVCSLAFGDGKLLPGNNYKYTLTVNKTGLIIDSNIIDWNEENVTGGAVSAD